MILQRLFRKPPEEAPAWSLYGAAVAQARQPVFYRALGVPDTLDGRFELVALHVYLILRRLRAEGAAGQALAQALFDAMFADMDRSLREMGAGDMGVGPRVKKMAQAFYGRMAAYDTALGPGGDAQAGDGEAAADDREGEAAATLEEAMRRNVYGTVAAPAEDAVAVLAAYVRREAEALAGQEGAVLCAGTVRFGAPPQP